MLRQEEQYVIRWLSQYGALPAQLLRRMLQKPPDVSDRIIRNLRKMGRIADIRGGYYLGLDPLCEPDQRTILALWVLARYIGQIGPFDHYPAGYPSQVFFLKNSTGYEIVVLYQGEESHTRLLMPTEGMKYIIVVSQIDMARRLVRPKAPCMLATVESAGEQEPQVTFYPEEVTDGGT